MNLQKMSRLIFQNVNFDELPWYFFMINICLAGLNSATKNPALFCSENKSEVHFDRTVQNDILWFGSVLKKTSAVFHNKTEATLKIRVIKKISFNFKSNSKEALFPHFHNEEKTIVRKLKIFDTHNDSIVENRFIRYFLFCQYFYVNFL